MQKIIKTTRYGVVSSSTEILATLWLRLARWLSAPPAQRAQHESAAEQAGGSQPRRRAGDPIGSVHFDGERLGGWPGEGRIR